MSRIADVVRMRHYLRASAVRIFAPSRITQLTPVDVHMKNGMERPMRTIAGCAATPPRVVTLAVRAAVCAGALVLLGGNALAAGPNANQATRMYNRIAGITPT